MTETTDETLQGAAAASHDQEAQPTPRPRFACQSCQRPVKPENVREDGSHRIYSASTPGTLIACGPVHRLPQAYVYHLALFFVVGPNSGFMSDHMVTPEPITDPSHVRDIEATIAERFSARALDDQGRAIIGAKPKARVTLISFTLLRAE
jgi:hypothetical protein